MKPVYMSPDLGQAETVKNYLQQKGIKTSLMRKQDPNNALFPGGVYWFELWLKDEADFMRAMGLVKQHEFVQLKNSINNKPTGKVKAINTTVHEPEAGPKTEEVAVSSPVKIALDKIARQAVKENSRQAAQSGNDTELPVNNQKVFGRIAEMMGFSEDEIKGEEFNNIKRPWNGEKLEDQVKALKQLCRVKSSREILDNT